MRLLNFILYGLAVCFSFNANSAFEMNGISLESFKSFEKDWKFVTVRYRKDTGELRFTYANDKAWKILSKGKGNYPDGAIFAKVSTMTMMDDAFPSSLIPSSQRRIQFMVRNEKKYKSTGGWGYALFKPTGETFSGDLKTKSQACAACHQIVKDRGQVFSQPMTLNFPIQSIRTGTDWRTRVFFKKRKPTKEEGKVLSSHQITFDELFFIEGELSNHLFFGTLDEIRPILIEKVKMEKIPSILFSNDKTQFSIVYLGGKGVCNKNELSLTAIHTTPNKKIMKLDICETI